MDLVATERKGMGVTLETAMMVLRLENEDLAVTPMLEIIYYIPDKNNLDMHRHLINTTFIPQNIFSHPPEPSSCIKT